MICGLCSPPQSPHGLLEAGGLQGKTVHELMIRESLLVASMNVGLRDGAPGGATKFQLEHQASLTGDIRGTSPFKSLFIPPMWVTGACNILSTQTYS